MAASMPARFVEKHGIVTFGRTEVARVRHCYCVSGWTIGASSTASLWFAKFDCGRVRHCVDNGLSGFDRIKIRQHVGSRLLDVLCLFQVEHRIVKQHWHTLDFVRLFVFVLEEFPKHDWGSAFTLLDI